MSSNDGLRIGDDERERAVNDLGDHFAAGRLTRDELDERLDRAWQAKTTRELAPLFADLPGDAVAVRPRSGRPAIRSDSGPRRGIPLPMLMILAIVLTVVTHLPVILFFLAWLVATRVFFGGHRRRTYAIGR